MAVRESEAKLQGRRLPKVRSSLRSLRRPCSGRMGPVPYFCVCGRGGVSVCSGRGVFSFVEGKGREGEAYGASDCAEEDCVCFFGGGECFVCEGGAGGVDGGLGSLLAGSILRACVTYPA